VLGSAWIVGITLHVVEGKASAIKAMYRQP
jgi:hypothetical protein